MNKTAKPSYRKPNITQHNITQINALLPCTLPDEDFFINYSIKYAVTV
jgi:hypothetical protein